MIFKKPYRSRSILSKYQNHLILLIMVMSGLKPILAQNDASGFVFSGIDYYSGRLVQGFGGAFSQSMSRRPNEDGQFNTTPSIYLGLSPQITLQFFDEVSWIRQNDFFLNEAVFSEKNFTSFAPGFRAQIRPLMGLQISTFLNVNNRKTLLNEQNLFDEQSQSVSRLKDSKYGLGLSYISQGGVFRLNRTPLLWMHYGDIKSPFMGSLFENSVLFPSKGQKMLSLTGDLARQDSKLTSSEIANTPTDTESRESSVNLVFRYGLTNDLALGLSVVPRHKSDTQNFDSNSSYAIEIAPRIDYATSRSSLHRLMFQYEYLENEQEPIDVGQSINSIVTKNFFRKGEVRYAFHQLWNVDAPTGDSFLANWNDDFGNRLPLHSLHFRMEMLVKNERYRNERQLDDIYSSSLEKNQALQFHVTTQYGLFDWLEIAWRTDVDRRWGKSDQNAQWNNRISWRNSFVLNFANYRYSKHLEHRFGWYDINSFNQLHGPLLSRDMFIGTVAVQPNYFAREWRSDGADYYDFMLPNQRVQTWFTEAQLRYGVLDNVELKISGVVNSPFVSTNLKERVLSDLKFSMAWQIWNSLRLKVDYFIERTDSPKFSDRKNIWKLNIVSLY